MSEITDLIYDTKRKMLAKYPRFGSEIAVASIEFKDNLPYHTAATDGKNIYVDPNYFASLSENDRLFTIAHEIMHIKFMHMYRLKDENGVNKTESEAPKTEPEKIDFSKVEIEPLFKDFVDFETFSKSDFRAVKVLACEAVPKSKKLLKITLDDGTGENRTILSGIHAYYEPEELVGKTCIAITNLPPRPMMGIDSCGMLISAVHHEEGEEKLHLLMVDDHIPAGAKLY